MASREEFSGASDAFEALPPSSELAPAKMLEERAAARIAMMMRVDFIEIYG
jgi:hypothetical protein